MLHVPGLYIQIGSKGRSIYTAEPLEKGDLIEICPIIKIPNGELELLDKTVIYNYYFIWEEDGYEACIALGFGSLYNHSKSPNAEVLMDYTDDTIRFYTLNTIVEDSEILIDYSGGTKGQIKIWFDEL